MIDSIGGRSANDKLGLGACRTWGVDSEKRPQRGQFLPDLQAHSPAMGQKAGEKWTAEAVSQPTIPKPDRLLVRHAPLDARGGSPKCPRMRSVSAVSRLAAMNLPSGKQPVMTAG